MMVCVLGDASSGNFIPVHILLSVYTIIPRLTNGHQPLIPCGIFMSSRDTVDIGYQRLLLT